jgi:hypothetical protein
MIRADGLGGWVTSRHEVRERPALGICGECHPALARSCVLDAGHECDHFDAGVTWPREPDMIVLRTEFGWSLRVNDDRPLADALVASADEPWAAADPGPRSRRDRGTSGGPVMTPYDNPGIRRRSRRRAWRGTPTGRRATRKVITTYGRHQRQAAWRSSWAGIRYDQPGGTA